MRTIAIKGYGDSDVFEALEMPIPEVRAGQVLIKVHASSLNPKDVMQRKGAFNDTLPAVLHSDFAGVIEAVGDTDGDLQVGDNVYGCAGGIAGQQGLWLILLR